MKSNYMKYFYSALLLLSLLLTACGGGGGSAVAPAATPTYSVGGTVSGLVGSVVLQDNGGNNLTVAANGAFTFATPVASGSPYSVTVLTQPTGQTCTVSTGTGIMAMANVTNALVTCSANAYSVGGTISGLTGSVVLQDNGGNNLTVAANGAFTFATPVASGSPYSVTVLTQPTGQTCTVSTGTGTMATANVSNVAVACVNVYSVGGTLSGLITGNSITLTDNGTDNLIVAASGVSQTFTFANKLLNGAAYNLMLSATTPTAQPCTSTYGAGTINAANVTTMNVICGLPGGLSTFTATGSMATARQNYTATLLPNGKVLVSGGTNAAGILASAELYDPASGTWTATGSMTTARSSHTATLLPNGKVLVSGGSGPAGILVVIGAGATGPLASTELYDPATGLWTATGSMTTARYYHTATLLPNGKVLVGGGMGPASSTGGVLASAELYDPATGLWTATGSMATARYYHTATLLPNGRVLVGGGLDASPVSLASAELYDPATGVWTATVSMATARAYHTATLLSSGRVLVSGGVDATFTALASAELYDPATGIWTATGVLTTARQLHTATLLPNGKLLVSGGASAAGTLASAELYDPATGLWTATGALATARYYHTATLLPNGKLLVSGGTAGAGAFASAEVYF